MDVLALRSPSSCAAKRVSAALSIVLLFALFTLPATSRAVEPSTDHDVVIVGAGAAGLYAAYTLNNLGFDVLVLEASDRHGGRVQSTMLGDVGVENGAEELYGNNGGNPIYNDIVAMYGAGAHTTPYSGDTLIVMDADGSNGGPNICVGDNACANDNDIYDYWDFYYDLGSHDNDPTDELVSTVLAGSPWFITPSSRNWHLFEGGVPGSELGTTVEKMEIRSIARQP